MAMFETPMMLQYQKLKKEYSDCILLFRLGDFYEMFMEDAKIGSSILNITLTSRSRGKDGKIPMCGVPYHALDAYLPKLIQAGYKVAIGEQVGEINGKELVKRDVVRIITPGTVLDEKSLEKKENNYIMGLHIENSRFGLALSDISTGNFYTEEYEIKELSNIIINEIIKYNPKECVLSSSSYNDPILLKLLKSHKNLNIYPYFEWDFYTNKAKEFIKDHFAIKSLKSYNLEEKEHAIKASAGLLGYLKHTQKSNISHIKKISALQDTKYVGLDRATIMNLEIFNTIREGAKKGTLLDFLDNTITSMGGRLLKEWLIKPLTDKTIIEKRYSCIEKYLNDKKLKSAITGTLENIGDLERILARISFGIGNPRDCVNLKNSLKEGLKIIDLNKNIKELDLNLELSKVKELILKIENTIEEESPIDPRNGSFIKFGNDEELDKLRKTVTGSKEFITKLEKEEKTKTGINSLKVKFNQVFGYYIEITKSNLEQVPDDYMRKQTLVNAERFITPALKEHEEIILTAEERTKTIEYNIFCEVTEIIKKNASDIQFLAKDIAKIDCLINFANIALDHKYVKPKIITTGEIKLKNNRHPVVEANLEEKEFVPNDVYLNNKEHQLIIITGPNMAGKSVYIRQVAITMLMAQIGCFVPAEEAEISLVDNIFVRSGASDIITAGLSTFMVEMVETANILNNATNDSLVIMDEIGRGTSTYDGISLAWAIAEYLVENNGIKPKTLFATHYHELQKLEEKYPNEIKNYHFPATEDQGEPIFLHTIKQGGASHSFGIQVAKIAGIPKAVYTNAQEILIELEKNGNTHLQRNYSKNETNKITKIIDKIDITRVTPLEALNILAEITSYGKNS